MEKRADNLMITVPYRILCIEDEPDLLEDLMCELRDAGHAVIGATNGQAGLDALAAATFDLVFCDVQLPHLSGTAVLAAARQTIGTAACPPFVLVTAFSDPQTRAEAQDHGAFDILVKPIDYGELHALVARLGRRRAPAA